MSEYRQEEGVEFAALARSMASLTGVQKRSTLFEVEARGPDGALVYREQFPNLVVNEGLTDAIDKHFKGSAYTALWYVGLTSSTPTVAAADTMGSHAGWTEVTEYTESVRQTLTLGTVVTGSVSNTLNKAVFTISTNSVGVGGCFVVNTATKGGTGGTLYGGGAHSQGNQVLASGSTITVTVTLTAAAA